jgi:hypothetical protein
MKRRALLPQRSGRPEDGQRRPLAPDKATSRVPADRPALHDPGRIGWILQLPWQGQADPLLPSDYFLG